MNAASNVADALFWALVLPGALLLVLIAGAVFIEYIAPERWIARLGKLERGRRRMASDMDPEKMARHRQRISEAASLIVANGWRGPET